MNIIKNIKIKYKLLLLVLLPIVFLLIMFIKISFDGFEQKQKAEILNKNIELDILISKMVHQLQNERDYSGFYFVSNASEYKEDLINSRKTVINI